METSLCASQDAKTQLDFFLITADELTMSIFFEKKQEIQEIQYWDWVSEVAAQRHHRRP